MNKTQLIENMAAKAEMSKKDAENLLNAFISTVQETLKTKEDVTMIGFGTFSSVLQKGKTGKVPGTDKTYTTEDKMAPKFKPGKTLKDYINS